MAFGQPSGPPASFRQLEELTGLLERAGHTDFRDARGPMGFTQRQAGGKFTRDEADAFIERLQADESVGAAEAAAVPAPRPVRAAPRARPPTALRDVPSDRLAAELQRRGWTVQGPDSDRPG